MKSYRNFFKNLAEVFGAKVKFLSIFSWFRILLELCVVLIGLYERVKMMCQPRRYVVSPMFFLCVI